MGGPADNDLDFATRHLTEQAQIMATGLSHDGLRMEMQKMHERWDAVRRSSSKSPRDFVKMAEDLRQKQSQVFDRTARGEWLGWLHPFTVDHFRRALDLHLGAIRGMAGKPDEFQTPQKELREWLRLMHDDAAILAQLLDPTEGQRIGEAIRFRDAFTSLYHGAQGTPIAGILPQAEQWGDQFSQWLASLNLGSAGAAAKSVIPPVLGEHVAREAKRFLYVVHRLAAPAQPPVGAPQTV